MNGTMTPRPPSALATSVVSAPDIGVIASAERRAAKGRPLIMLGLLMGSWVTVRAMTWETPFPRVLETVGGAVFAEATARGSTADIVGLPMAGPSISAHRLPRAPAGHDALGKRSYVTVPLSSQYAGPAGTAMQAQPIPSSGAPFLLPASSPALQNADMQMAVSHQLMWMAAMAYMPVPASVASALQSDPAQTPLAFAPVEAAPFEAARLQSGAQQGRDRWSLDAWAFWRQGSALSAAGLGRSPSYGASQAGAVLRYELGPVSPHRPSARPSHRPRAYMRGYSSLEGSTEQEIAAGLSMRVVPRVPLRLHAEGRVLRSSRKTEPRAAAFVTTELPPARLPAGFTGEVYGQAGYVTGRAKTAFADGQAHVLREVASFDLAKVKVGGAAFAGAQKGASRVDLGPAMRVDMQLGGAPARLSVDYRAKVAGDAQPDSGFAVTLSTRF